KGLPQRLVDARGDTLCQDLGKPGVLLHPKRLLGAGRTQERSDLAPRKPKSRKIAPKMARAPRAASTRPDRSISLRRVRTSVTLSPLPRKPSGFDRSRSNRRLAQSRFVHFSTT